MYENISNFSASAWPRKPPKHNSQLKLIYTEVNIYLTFKLKNDFHLKSSTVKSFWLGEARDGAVVIVLASHQCGPSSNPGVDVKCGLSLLLVLFFALKGFSPGTPVFPSPQKPKIPWISNSNSTRNQARQRTILWMCYLQIIIYLFIYFIISKFDRNPSKLVKINCQSSMLSPHWDPLFREIDTQATFW